jgi:hypothetical protein
MTRAPTLIERRMAADLKAFAATAKYPIRPWAVLSQEQLAAARAQMGAAAFRPAKGANWHDVDRHPLTPKELRATRAEVGMISRRDR